MRQFKLVFLVLLIAFGSSAANNPGFYENERIISYHSDIVVQNNCKVLIKETIEVYAGGSSIQRGIFRDLPLSYKYKGGNTHVGFELINVTRNGHNEPFHTEHLSNGIRIYAGESDVFLEIGRHRYEIIYEVNHVLGFFEDYDEIYWNVNGNGWGFSIEEISATVYYPSGSKLVQYAGYTGYSGEAGKNYTTRKLNGGIIYEAKNGLLPGENLTISVAWDKGHLVYPTDWEKFVFWLKSYILWVIGISGLLIGLVFNYRNWSKYGRDPKPGTIIPLYYAPNGFSPAECAYLRKGGKSSSTMFGSTLMSLAVKRHVDIKAEEEKGWGSSTTFMITRSDDKEKKQELNDIEESFFKKLMGSKDLVVIKKGKYNPRVAGANTDLRLKIDSKQKDKYFIRNNHLKGKQFIFPVAFAILGFLAYWMYGGFVGVIIGALVLHVVMNIIFARLYEQPTKIGRRLMDEIAGFAMYLKYADKQRIKLMNPPTMNFKHFEENLAYAIALDVAEEWSNQFDPKELQEFSQGHMPYYHGMAIGSMRDFSSSLSSTISSASTPPSSSGSGSGGGGFSGGGGGGGGGGGW